MDIYTLNLTGLLALCTGLFLTQRQPSSSPFPSPSSKPKSKSNPLQSHPQLPFFLVYALVMSSDWLQGPFLYSLYHDEHRLPASFVSTLFTTGFLSGAISGSLIGRLADRHGRKSACLAFCAVYALSCVLTTVPDKAVLFLGRVLGGVGTSLLFSVFESWMVSDFRARALGGRGVDLSRTFGLMSTVNSVVAIACGVGSEWLVGWAGTRKAPFWASVVCCGLAGVVIWASWDENYGETTQDSKSKPDQKDITAKPNIWSVLFSPKVLSLGLASTIFEGSMYLFVFFWTPALRSVAPPDKSLPYGVIFASFMAATLASSLGFGIVTARGLVGYTSLLLGILGSSALCFVLSAQPRSEQSAFWVFCLFEAAVGMYFPCMGYLKGRLVDDAVRAQVYGMLRVPLNVFVVVSLLITGGGGDFSSVFTVCATLLVAAAGATWAATASTASP